MNILVGITGSVATTVIHKLVMQLIVNYKVEAVATESSRYFWADDMPRFNIWTEHSEWPGLKYQKNQTVKHIELRDWADMMVIAPITANTLAKIANGICDNLLTSVARAWILDRPLVIAPAMNTQMWLHPVTANHLAKLNSWYNLFVVPPANKDLACGEQGVGALADISEIVQCVKSIEGGNYNEYRQKDYSDWRAD